MGFSASSHFFNKVVQKHLEDIPNSHLEIDDVLIEGKDENETIDSFRQLLERCRQKKVFLARHKLEAGEEVEFAGVHIGGPLGYRPVQSKLDAIIKLKHPENLTELRSFVGMVNQLRSYMPDFHHSMTNLQKLMKKDAEFIWDDEKQSDFDQIK